MLTKRLAACAALVTEGGVVCDVGTDHAYLPAELLRQNRCPRAVVTDIHAGPLEAARRTLTETGVLAGAELLLCDGLEPCWKDGRGFGWTDTSTRAWTPQALAQQLQSVFGGAVRYSAKETPIRKIAYCSGSAASMLELAAAQGCDALITGDIKHDRWYAAEFSDVALFDCGHYGTERFAAEILAAHIRAAHPEVTVIAQAGADPAEICAGGEEQ